MKDTITDFGIYSILFGFLCAIFFLGYIKGRQEEKKEQEQLAIQAGIGYYSVDQKDGTVKFKHNF